MNSTLNVSRETSERLEIYLAELKRWNPKINLVSKSTLEDAAQRHFEDSLQILRFAPDDWQKWVDIGSGGGFPGLVVAAACPEADVHLIESDMRKCLFMRTVARLMSVNVTVHNERSEQLAPQAADIISARAFAPLVKLLDHAERHGVAHTTCILPKGQNAMQELTDARKRWKLSVEQHPSLTDASATILLIKDFQRVTD
ncbi:16S rRNA (guanine(527)-N(7))-methyltransferase RsmG [Pontivivens insulae]|uniref:Ribosomal RNA small subunit methyltransferase G n=1 Tax=Pontivivens insulae TaxID=1639689 RepID=A0A2R8A891_9RHOB|nr:16S rRNA (guanine(527)-N(7))-methyltransferase RsmG [Pontivivens insulae]RED18340.1 16S rRNA m(7)G-527 methyltransferase [Pontivivens insulae]SPF28238.1 Ribosomal RNA small subunit methyltransferase G [Pontivivens insulae]